MKSFGKIIAVFCLSAAVITSLMAAGCGKTDRNADISSETDIEEEAVGDESTQAGETAGDTSDSRDTEGTETITITLNEVAHSIFYAPMYVAIEEGYFEEEGIDLDLVCGYGADKVMAAVLAGEADIGFMGPETTVYAANEGANDQVVNFAQLTQRAGNFLVAREDMEDFAWSDLIGTTVLGGREGVVHIFM